MYLTPAQTGWVTKQRFKTSQIQLHWRLEQVGTKIFLLPDEPAHWLILNGKVGLKYQVPTINYYASKLFASSMANEVLAVNEEMYELGVSHCSKAYFLNSPNNGCEVHIADSMYGFRHKLYWYGAVNAIACGVRPAVSLKSNIYVVISEEGDGSKEKPWKILKSERIYLEKLIQKGEEWLEKL